MNDIDLIFMIVIQASSNTYKYVGFSSSQICGLKFGISL